MIIKEDNGNWLAKCDLCQWKTLQPKRSQAQNKLSNHINKVHKKGIKTIDQQKVPNSPAKMPPNLPAPIKEN
ncbi:MAG: hypothetical protein IAX21_06690 [Candidatus Bathyarchaeota archaeon]|nr:hypothetical protein [Candidatus Bathyarchaeum tardum]WGM89368.1 MAG: hypothetical protein NUK63_10765 [Candidatus Bathyarchaeum tardum]WNZ28357.1 MAG: hypothetical protein IAX21_06690 [Candidatus Bathyarchaeota archaeon]